MERAPGETALIDRTGRMLKMEPLATVESLEQYLLKMVWDFRLFFGPYTSLFLHFKINIYFFGPIGGKAVV